MNKIESVVYNIVKNNYWLKNIVRNIYQGCYDLLPNYGSTFKGEVIVRENCFSAFMT